MVLTDHTLLFIYASFTYLVLVISSKPMSLRIRHDRQVRFYFCHQVSSYSNSLVFVKGILSALLWLHVAWISRQFGMRILTTISTAFTFNRFFTPHVMVIARHFCFRLNRRRSWFGCLIIERMSKSISNWVIWINVVQRCWHIWGFLLRYILNCEARRHASRVFFKHIILTVFVFFTLLTKSIQRCLLTSIITILNSILVR